MKAITEVSNKIIDSDIKDKLIREEALKELISKYKTKDKIPEIIELRKKSKNSKPKTKGKKKCGCK